MMEQINVQLEKYAVEKHEEYDNGSEWTYIVTHERIARTLLVDNKTNPIHETRFLLCECYRDGKLREFSSAVYDKEKKLVNCRYYLDKIDAIEDFLTRKRWMFS